jgi:hypothetical protein
MLMGALVIVVVGTIFLAELAWILRGEIALIIRLAGMTI